MAFRVTQDEQLITDRPVEPLSERELIWQRLSPLNRELFIGLYGSQEAFLAPEIISPLEPYIIQYDQNMDDEGLIRQLAFRMGIDMPRNADAAVYFYWVMLQVIMTFGLTGQVGNGIPPLRQIINMTRPEYYNWRGNDEEILTYTDQLGPFFEEGESRTTDTYHQRLLIFLDEARLGVVP